MVNYKTFTIQNQYGGITNVKITDAYNVEEEMPDTFQYYIKLAASRPLPTTNPYAAIVSYDILENNSGDTPVNAECALLFDEAINGFTQYTPDGELVQHNFDYSYTEVIKGAYTDDTTTSTDTVQRPDFPYSQTTWNLMSDELMALYPLNFEIEFSTNMPIFETAAECEAYKSLTGEDRIDYLAEHCINYGNKYEESVTEDYYVYCNYGTGSLLNGSFSVSGTTSWKSLRFKANALPSIVLNRNNFGATLSATKVVTSYGTNGEPYTLDYVPESQWPQDDTYITPSWYSDLIHYANAFGTLPENGTYTGAISLQTNVPVFTSQEDADEATRTGDFSKAINAYELDSVYYMPPVIGEEEIATLFGDGGVTSPFIQTYLCNRNEVLNIANAFYSSDSSLINNIKNGLELFGSEPFQALVGLKYFPFDVSQIVNTSGQNYIYFGSYKHDLNDPIAKVINLKQNAYINAGTVTLTPVQDSYRSFEPYCGLSVYLPYIGWQKLRIADYWGKTVNVRYYVDIYTGSCIAALVANGVFVDYFTGSIGIELPITGQMLSQYANSALNAVLGTAGGVVGGAASGAMAGSVIPGIGTAAGAIAGAAIGAAGGLATGTFKMAQKGAPKDHNTTKGNFTSSVGAYLPQYVIFRFDVHDLIIPDLLTDLYGRPSSASGKVSSFSGFLQADTVKLNTTGMSEEDANAIAALLKEGIFI